jgi:hypothetical protein
MRKALRLLPDTLRQLESLDRQLEVTAVIRPGFQEVIHPKDPAATHLSSLPGLEALVPQGVLILAIPFRPRERRIILRARPRLSAPIPMVLAISAAHHTPTCLRLARLLRLQASLPVAPRPILALPRAMISMFLTRPLLPMVSLRMVWLLMAVSLAR